MNRNSSVGYASCESESQHLDQYTLTRRNIRLAAKQSWSKFNHYKKLDFLIFIKGEKAIKIDREIIEKGYEQYHYELSKMQKED